MRSTLIITIVVISVIKANATSFRDVTLKELIMKSEMIVYGVVTESSRLDCTIRIPDFKKYESTGNVTYKASIKLIQQFKSQTDKEIIQIGYSHGPKSSYPVYNTGDTVLVFLKYNQKENFYLTISPWAGTKKIGTDIFNTYSKRINELLNNLPLNEKSEFINEWLVKCAENYNTSWNGALELNKEYTCINYDSIDLVKINLNEKQKLRLKKALLSFERINYSHIELLNQVISFGEINGLKEYCLTNLKQIDKPNLWLGYDIMKAVYKIDPKRKYKRLINQFLKTSWLMDHKKKLVKQTDIISKYIIELEKSDYTTFHQTNPSHEKALYSLLYSPADRINSAVL